MKKLLIFCVLFFMIVGCDNTLFDQRVDTCSNKKMTVENIETMNVNQILQFDKNGNIIGVNMNYAISPDDVIEEISEYNREQVLQREMIKANTNFRYILYMFFFVVGCVIGRLSCKHI